MLDTDRYREWLALLAASDLVLVQLAAIGAAAVLVWETLRALPDPWRATLRTLYLAVALGYLLAQLSGPWALYLGVGLLVARAVWIRRGRQIAAALTKGQINDREHATQS